MQSRNLNAPAAATVAFTVVVAGAGMGGCGDEVTVQGGQGAQGGTTTGSTSTSTSTSTDTTTTSVSTSNTSSTAHTSCDPACLGGCPTPQELSATGAVADTTLTMTVDVPVYYEEWCFDGWAADPVVTVAPELGTLVSATQNDGPTMEVVIELADGTIGGEVIVELQPRIEQAYDCSSGTIVTCPVTKVFQVSIGADGQPIISRLEGVDDPALHRRPPMRLTFVEGHGTEATIEVQGAPADLALRFDVTDGEVESEGSTARWRLPERAGWYQIEVVAEHQGMLATDALMVEVRPTAKRG